MLDLVASMVVRGAIVYIVLTMNISLNELLYEKAQYAIVKQNTATMVDVLRNDFRYIGYGVSVGNPFLLADSNQVRFQGDIDNNGIVDTLYFSIGPVSEMAGTPNPSDRIIYRRRNSGTPFEFGHGVTQFHLTYYNATGNVTTSLSEIKTFKVRIMVQGDREINRYYPTSVWESHILPSNI
ncbi:MAG: hypothetical protein WEF53_00715 [Bacteroidota bacterium]